MAAMRKCRFVSGSSLALVCTSMAAIAWPAKVMQLEHCQKWSRRVQTTPSVTTEVAGSDQI